MTRYDPGERYPTVDLSQSALRGAGLPEWRIADRRLEEQDVVLWDTFGSTHPRGKRRS